MTSLLLLALLLGGASAHPAEPPMPAGSAPRPDTSSAWDSPHLVGLVPRTNVADLSERLHRTDNYYPIEDYLDLLLVKLGSLPPASDDPDAYPLDAMLRGDIRAKPFPEIIYFKHVTDYYRRRPLLQRKLEERLQLIPEEVRIVGVRNYIWLMLYLGEFQKVIELLEADGKYSALVDDDGSLSFALAQAHYRLGRFADSLPHAKRAHSKLPDSVLDTRWQLMLSNLGREGRDFLHSPDPGYYTKRHIKEIFQHSSWEDFPFADVTEKLGVDRWGGTGSFWAKNARGLRI